VVLRSWEDVSWDLVFRGDCGSCWAALLEWRGCRGVLALMWKEVCSCQGKTAGTPSDLDLARRSRASMRAREEGARRESVRRRATRRGRGGRSGRENLLERAVDRQFAADDLRVCFVFPAYQTS
jgi:hypothetical protein